MRCCCVRSVTSVLCIVFTHVAFLPVQYTETGNEADGTGRSSCVNNERERQHELGQLDVTLRYSQRSISHRPGGGVNPHMM